MVYFDVLFVYLFVAGILYTAWCAHEVAKGHSLPIRESLGVIMFWPISIVLVLLCTVLPNNEYLDLDIHYLP